MRAGAADVPILSSAVGFAYRLNALQICFRSGPERQIGRPLHPRFHSLHITVLPIAVQLSLTFPARRLDYKQFKIVNLEISPHRAASLKHPGQPFSGAAILPPAPSLAHFRPGAQEGHSFRWQRTSATVCFSRKCVFSHNDAAFESRRTHMHFDKQLSKLIYSAKSILRSRLCASLGLFHSFRSLCTFSCLTQTAFMCAQTLSVLTPFSS